MKLLSLPLLLLSLSSTAWGAGFCQDPELAKQPILAEGRVMPLFAYTQQVRGALFPKKTCTQLSATKLYCLLSLGQSGELVKDPQCQLNLKIEHIETRKLLNLEENQKTISPELVRQNHDKLLSTYHSLKDRGEEGGGLAKDIANLLTAFEKWEAITSGADWKILVEGHEWKSLNKILQSPATHDEPTLRAILFGGSKLLSAEELRNLKLESLYEKTRPFSAAIFICLLGFLLAILSLKSERFIAWTEAALAGVALLEIYGMSLRVLVSGRAPVTNMYETVMWAGFAAFILSAILGFKLKDRRIWAAGFAGNTICLFMMRFATGMLDSTIQPLVPVLRDNFWLSTHVTTITFSYGCLFLSWVISNFLMLHYLLQRRSKGQQVMIDKWNYINRIAIQVGVVFLAAGVLLGGVWADYSWGRFWGWDPKETWSLIALIVYVTILHGRYIGWFKGILFTIMGGFGFLFILMAWFGVNYILATGLHSYGFSSGGSLFLATIFLAQLAILGATYLQHLKSEK